MIPTVTDRLASPIFRDAGGEPPTSSRHNRTVLVVADPAPGRDSLNGLPTNCGSCSGTVPPRAETCNGLDDDCNGIEDDNCVP